MVTQMSEYQLRLRADLNIDPPNSEKLVLTKVRGPLQKPAVLSQTGNAFGKVHRVIEFDQEPYMVPYIRMNTDFRKQAKSDFETNFYKLMNNSVFDKTMENLRTRVDVKVVRSSEEDKIRKLVASPSFSTYDIFGNDLAGIHMQKTKLFLNKPMYTGMTIFVHTIK